MAHKRLSDANAGGAGRNRYDISDRLPDSPAETIPFGVYAPNVTFVPAYYPSRMSITTEKEFEKISSGCEGQEIDIKTLKNSTLHISGKVHAKDMGNINRLSQVTEPVDVLTPILEGGGMEFHLESAERGQLIGYDAFPAFEDWMFEYTLDLLSTGKDEYEQIDYSRFSAGPGL